MEFTLALPKRAQGEGCWRELSPQPLSHSVTLCTPTSLIRQGARGFSSQEGALGAHWRNLTGYLPFLFRVGRLRGLHSGRGRGEDHCYLATATCCDRTYVWRKDVFTGTWRAFPSCEVFGVLCGVISFRVPQCGVPFLPWTEASTECVRMRVNMYMRRHGGEMRSRETMKAAAQLVWFQRFQKSPPTFR